MKFRMIFEIARNELVINIRNKWMIIFAFAFGVLVVCVAYVGMMAEGFSGAQGFTRTTASLLNLVLYIVPLVSLTMGTLSFVGDKGTTELLFSQPVSRMEVLVSKLVGLFVSVTLSSLMGFSAAGVIVAAAHDTEGLARFVGFVVLSLVLAAVFLSIAGLSAMASKRRSRAFGLALFSWFFFVLLYDLLAIGIALLLSGPSSNLFLLFSLLGNPVDMVRVASLIILGNATIFGPAGAALLRYFGGTSASIGFLTIGMLLWVVTPVMISRSLIRRQDI